MNISPIKTPISFKNAASVAADAVKNAPKVVAEGVKDVKFMDKFLYEPLAKGIGKVADLKATEKIVDTISKWKSPYQRLCDIGSVVLTVFTVKDTLKSKKISEERKPFMVVNNILVTAVSSTLAAVIDNLTYTPQKMIAMAHAQNTKKNLTPKMLDEFKKGKDSAQIIENVKSYLKNAGEVMEDGVLEQKAQEYGYIFKNTEKFWTGLGKVKSTFIFTAIVRFLVPIAFVPITAKIIDKLEERAKNKKASKNQSQQTTQAQQPVQAQQAAQNAAAPKAPNAINNNSSIINPINTKPNA